MEEVSGDNTPHQIAISHAQIATIKSKKKKRFILKHGQRLTKFTEKSMTIAGYFGETMIFFATGRHKYNRKW